MDVGCTSGLLSISSDIFADYRVTGGTGRFGGAFRGSWNLRSPWIQEYWEVCEGFGGGGQEFWEFPALGGLPEFGSGETPGVPGFGGLWGPWDLGGSQVWGYWEGWGVLGA